MRLRVKRVIRLPVVDKKAIKSLDSSKQEVFMAEQAILGSLTRIQLLKDAKEVFFYAMSRGYVSGAEPSLASNNRKRLDVYLDDTWLCADTWNDEGGCTTISYQSNAVWVMRYFGHYAKEAIPCLKYMLANRYELHDFCGGRGAPCSFWGEESPFSTLIYSNDWNGSFEKFSGIETIRRIGENRILGHHQYWGGMLI